MPAPAVFALAALVPLAWQEDAPTPPAVAAAVDEATRDAEASWSVMLLGGERIGYVKSSEGETPAGDLAARLKTAMMFKRFGQELRMTVDLASVESPAGELQSFELLTDNPGSAPTTAVGTREGDTLTIVTTVNGKSTSREVALPADAKGPSFIDRTLTEDPPEPGETREFATFFPELGRAGRITIAAAGAREPVELPTGETRDLLPVTITQDVLPIPTVAYLDDAGQAVVEKMDLMGQEMVIFEVTESEALAEIVGQDLDLGLNTLIDVPVVPNVHAAGTVTYRIAVDGRDAADFFPATDTQRVEATDDGAARVTVTRRPIPADAVAGEALDLLKPTRYLQSDDPRVRAHAEAATVGTTMAGQVALACERYVHEKMAAKAGFSVALASAGEVAENLAGDCTEHAVLLAAMLRAEGVPSRVCLGFVTIPGRGKLGGHMWTEALLRGPDDTEAAWTPLDATLGRGGIGGGHLLLARSSLADDAAAPIAGFLPVVEVIGRMTVDVVTE